MKTLIFNSHLEFLSRENKEINGVSKSFAGENPNYEGDNESNLGCWNCRSCRNCRSCSDCHSCRSCRDCGDCRSCRDCGDCSDCSDCHSCSDCRSCRDCSDCSDCSDKEGSLKGLTPRIENIHQSVFSAVSKDASKLQMNSWHSECGTAHCRAGWIVALAGNKGSELEVMTDTAFAAMLIYEKSSNIKVPLNRFFDSQEAAIKDIERCAKEEIALTKKTNNSN